MKKYILIQVYVCNAVILAITCVARIADTVTLVRCFSMILAFMFIFNWPPVETLAGAQVTIMFHGTMVENYWPTLLLRRDWLSATFPKLSQIIST